jgi:DNA ligase (NAD+)
MNACLLPIRPSLLAFACLIVANTLGFIRSPGAVPDEVRLHHANIEQLIRSADQAYFLEHRSEMSDEAYDALKQEQAQLVANYPELADPQTVGATAESHQRVPHRRPVLSLRKVYSDEALVAFCKQSAPPSALWLLQTKIDGVSVLVDYRNGRLERALSRGDRESGIEVTAALLASGALPANLSDAPPLLELRGEVYIDKADFKEWNRLRAETGENPHASARNLASAALMLKDPLEVRRRKLQMRVFECCNASELGWNSDLESLAKLKSMGLPVVESWRATGPDQVLGVLARLEPTRAELPYASDGWVVKLDDLSQRRQIGETRKYPKWAVARKFTPLPVITTVIAIERQVSEKGKITPVARLQPVVIDGVRVERASLHSEAYAQAMGIIEGSRVRVIRAGSAVPQIVGLAETGEAQAQ